MAQVLGLVQLGKDKALVGPLSSPQWLPGELVYGVQVKILESLFQNAMLEHELASRVF